MVGVGLTCLILGIGGTVAAILLAPQWFTKPPSQIVATQSMPPSLENRAATLYTEPKLPGVNSFPNIPNPAGDDPGKPEKPAELQPTGPVAQGAPGPRGPSTVPPYNPFGGPIPENWNPSVSPSGAGNLPQGEIHSPKPTVTPTVESTTFVTARGGSGADAESDANQLVSTLQSHGAVVRTAPHYNLAGGVVGVQVVAAVPKKSMEAALSQLRSAGYSQTGKWTVSPSERDERVSSMLSLRIQELKSAEAQLLAKYQDDATEVVLVREEIQNLNRAIGAAKSGKADRGLIVIGIGSL
jgi:hypothetical protein